MRLFQALVAGNGPLLGAGSDTAAALRWLEAQPPPTLLAPSSQVGVPCPLYVPNNAMDVVAKSWARGNNEASIAEHRTLKMFRPTHMRGGDTVHYLWTIPSNDADSVPIEPLARAVERIVALGWGIDLVVAQCRVLPTAEPFGEGLERWTEAQGLAAGSLRCPSPGSLDELIARHAAFLNRLADDTFYPVPPLTTYRNVGFSRPSDSPGRSVACFELLQDDGSFCRYPQRDLVHIAGMVRHLAIKAMEKSPPNGVAADWVEAYVAGHARPGNKEHRQFSYLPLPSIGHRHVDPSVRRVMIAAPLGDDRLLEYLAQRLNGWQLQPKAGTNFSGEPPALARVKYDKVARYYLEASDTWASVTPVILPGHDDHKPAKTRKLIEAALRQSGVEQACEFEWSSFSRFPKSLSAHKYGKDKKPAGYRHPDHLEGLSAVHLVLRFADNVQVPGPLVIGAGRHCGLGMMANLNAPEDRSDS